MPIESTFPMLDIPNIDLWAFLFEREDNSYPDNKGIHLLVHNISVVLIKIG
jgi:4-coumarate--CoA ligase